VMYVCMYSVVISLTRDCRHFVIMDKPAYKIRL